MRLSSGVKTSMSHYRDLNVRSTPPLILLAVLCQPPVLSQTLPDCRLFLISLRLQTKHQCDLSSGNATNLLSLCQTFSITGKGRTFLWLPEHQVEFGKLKFILSGNLVVWHFDHTKPVYLLTDASRLFGLGYSLGHIELDNSGKEFF